MTQEQEEVRYWNDFISRMKQEVAPEHWAYHLPRHVYLAVDAELTRLRNIEKNTSSIIFSIQAEREAERKRIAEAVREKYPDFIITEALAIGIERGEFGKGGE